MAIKVDSDDGEMFHLSQTSPLTVVVADHCAISYPVAEAVSRAKRTEADGRLTERASPTWSLGWCRGDTAVLRQWIDRLRRQTAIKP